MEVTFKNNTLFITDNNGISADFSLENQDETDKAVQVLIRFFEMSNHAKLVITDEDIAKKTIFCSSYCKAGEKSLEVTFFADQNCTLQVANKEGQKNTLNISFDEFCIILQTILKNKRGWKYENWFI